MSENTTPEAVQSETTGEQSAQVAENPNTISTGNTEVNQAVPTEGESVDPAEGEEPSSGGEQPDTVTTAKEPSNETSEEAVPN